LIGRPGHWRLLSAAKGSAAALFLFLALLPPLGAGAADDFSAARVTLLKNRDYAVAFLAGIGDARSSIVISTYLFKVADTGDSLPRRIVEELIRARKRGVAVTVILESSADKTDSLNRENHHTADILARGGVKVFFDSPRITSHAKVAVIDGRYVYLGSHNLTQAALVRNNELSVLVDSPAMAAEIRAYLDRL
jgi:phosphatidylserine/phosphatidylglycerophosphate/cardiolipin synthase-like enzyme